MKYTITIALMLVANQVLAIEITDYKPPVNKLTDWDLYGDFYGLSDEFNTTDTAGTNHYSNRFHGEISSRFKSFFESEKFG
jgi:hypothetical protein